MFYKPNQPRTPYNSTWLADFTQQNKQKMDGQNVMALNLYGQQPSYPTQSNYPAQPNYPAQSSQQSFMPGEDLMSRYNQDTNRMGSIGAASNQIGANSGQIGAATNQLAAYMQPSYGNEGNSAPDAYQEPSKPFYDEGGDLINVKKQPKPAYDWSQDFG